MTANRQTPAAGFGRARRLVRPVLQFSRAVPARIRLMGQGADRPLAVFLPSGGRNGASLLRIYCIADRLRDHGWRALVLPRTLTLAQRHRLLARARPDVLVMQGVRHALNRPALYPDQPIVLDMDDADFHLPHLTDVLRVAMPQVSAVIAGSDYVAEWCRGAGAPVAETVWTGMPVSAQRRPAHDARPPVIAWAQTRPMTYTGEAERVLDLMRRLAPVHPGLRLRLYDRRPEDDPAFAARFEAAGVAVEWCDAMPLTSYLSSFDDVALGLAPLSLRNPFSRGKSVGKVLGYLDRHVPVIASAAGEHDRIFDTGTAVVSNDMDVWVARATALLADPGARQGMADAGFELFCRRLSSAAAAARVVGILDTLLPLAGQARAPRLSG